VTAANQRLAPHPHPDPNPDHNPIPYHEPTLALAKQTQIPQAAELSAGLSHERRHLAPRHRPAGPTAPWTVPGGRSPPPQRPQPATSTAPSTYTNALFYSNAGVSGLFRQQKLVHHNVSNYICLMTHKKQDFRWICCRHCRPSCFAENGYVSLCLSMRHAHSGFIGAYETFASWRDRKLFRYKFAQWTTKTVQRRALRSRLGLLLRVARTICGLTGE